MRGGWAVRRPAPAPHWRPLCPSASRRRRPVPLRRARHGGARSPAPGGRSRRPSVQGRRRPGEEGRRGRGRAWAAPALAAPPPFGRAGPGGARRGERSPGRRGGGGRRRAAWRRRCRCPFRFGFQPAVGSCQPAASRRPALAGRAPLPRRRLRLRGSASPRSRPGPALPPALCRAPAGPAVPGTPPGSPWVGFVARLGFLVLGRGAAVLAGPPRLCRVGDCLEWAGA